MFGEIFWQEMQHSDQKEELAEQIGLPLPERAAFEDETTYQKAMVGFWRAVTKTALYRQFVGERIAPAEEVSGLVGNVYAGSVFLALMGTLEHGLSHNSLEQEATLGFFAYGSGSKSKVFKAQLQAGWKAVVEGFGLLEHLQKRTAIDYATYEQLHRGSRTQAVDRDGQHFYQTAMDADGKRAYHIPTAKSLATP